MNRKIILSSKIKLYRVLLNIPDPDDLTSDDTELLLLLSQDKDIQKIFDDRIVFDRLTT